MAKLKDQEGTELAVGDEVVFIVNKQVGSLGFGKIERMSGRCIFVRTKDDAVRYFFQYEVLKR